MDINPLYLSLKHVERWINLNKLHLGINPENIFGIVHPGDHTFN